MKHLFFLLLAGWLLFQSKTVYSQCVPDTTIGDTVGLYPRFLADGIIGQAYDQVINIVFPQDTVLQAGTTTLNPDFCNFRIDSVPNLPPGLTYACNTPNCVWVIDHTPGVINRGCISITGTPTDTIPGDSLEVYVNAGIGFYNASLNSCLPLTLPPPFDTLTVQKYRTRFKIQTASSIDRTLSRKYSLQTRSGGAQTQVWFEMPQAGVAFAEVLDLTGRVLLRTESSPLSAGPQQFALTLPGTSTGLFFTRLWVNDAPVAVEKWLHAH